VSDFLRRIKDLPPQKLALLAAQLQERLEQSEARATAGRAIAVVGEVVSSLEGEPTGHITTSSELVNKMWKIGIWGQRGKVVGQSGVGKSSLLNAVDPELSLRIAAVSAETQIVKHTTTTARLIPLSGSVGYVVDTPGIRQFQLWDVIPAEVGGYFRDLRPFINKCRFPNCTHRHEADCAVKDAVADGWLDARRYESYCQLFEGDQA
jgi:ribosome biogenesis GTPase